MNTVLSRQFEYFLHHRTELLEKYNGRVVVIHDQEVEGVFGSELEALKAAKEKFADGTFLVQRIAPESDSFSQTFHSRVAIH